jgi:hypothetical protein
MELFTFNSFSLKEMCPLYTDFVERMNNEKASTFIFQTGFMTVGSKKEKEKQTS